MADHLSIRVAPIMAAREKRASVSQTIASYATGHQIADVGINIATCWIPGGGLVALAGAMAIQAPLVYRPMVRDIAKTYLVNALDPEVKAMIDDAAIEGAEWDIGGHFGITFFEEIIWEILTEMGLGAGLGLIPVIGSFVAAYYDAKIAATLTWRVGLTAALYYENGGEWFGDRKTTYEKARRLLGPGLSAKTADRFDFEKLGSDEDLRRRQASLLVRYARLVLKIMKIEPLREVLLRDARVNPDIVENVLDQVRRWRVEDGRPSAAARERYVRCGTCRESYARDEPYCPHCGAMEGDA